MAEVTRVLVEYLAAPDVGQASAVTEIVGIGPVALPSVWTILSGGAPAPEGLEGPLLRKESEAILLESLRAWPADRVVQGIADSVEPESSLEDRLRAIELEGDLGLAGGFEEVLELAAGISPFDYKKPRAQRAVESALANLLEQDDLAMGVLETKIHDIDPRVLGSVARSLGEVCGSESLRHLRRITGRNRELDAAVLEALGAWDHCAPEAIDGSCADLALEYLDSAAPDLRRHAAIALGNLRHGPSTQGLLDLLHDSDRRVQRAAAWSLQRISGLGWSLDSGNWERWYEGEQTWLDANRPALDRLATETDGGRVGQVLHEVAKHPLFRREVSERVTPLLEHPEEWVAIAAGNVLARLADPVAIQPLILALEDRRAGVRASAGSALVSMTGEGLPPNADDWRAWLER